MSRAGRLVRFVPSRIQRTAHSGPPAESRLQPRTAQRASVHSHALAVGSETEPIETHLQPLRARRPRKEQAQSKPRETRASRSPKSPDPTLSFLIDAHVQRFDVAARRAPDK